MNTDRITLPKPTELKTGLIVLISLFAMFQPLALDPYLPSITQMAKDFGVDGSVIQLSLTAFTLGVAAGMLVCGPLSDSIGRRRPLIAAVAGYALAGVMVAFAASIPVFFAGRILQGFCGSSLIVIVSAMLRDLYSDRTLVRAMGRSLLIQASSWILGPFLGAAVVLYSDWRNLSLLLAIAGTALLIVAALKVPDTMPLANRHRSTLSELLTRFGSVFRDRTYNGLVIVQCCVVVALFSYLSIAPFVYVGTYGLPDSSIGIWAGINSMAAYLGSQIGSRLSLRFGPQWVLLSALAIGAAAGVGQLVTANLELGFAAFTGMLALYCLGFGMTVNPIYSLSMLPHPNEAGTANAMIGVSGMLATTAAGPLYVVLDHDSAAGIGITQLVAMLLAIVVLFLVVRPRTLAALA